MNALVEHKLGHKLKPTDCDNVNDMNNKTKISVIIPVFNGENFIAETLDSILKQTLIDFEILCVNDSSTDNSFQILKKYQELDNRVHVLNTDINKGIASKVLNYAIPSCTGQYIFYMSQDDLLSETCLENLYNKAVTTKADAVIPDVYYYYKNKSVKKSIIGVDGNRDIELTNREAVLLSLNWLISGNALWNSNIVKRIKYDEFGINGDEYSVRKFFISCNKVLFAKGIFFYRQDNPNAITKKLSYKSFDLPYTHFKLCFFLKENGFPFEDYSKQLIKAIRRLINYTIVLQKNRHKLSHYAILEAEYRIKKCFYRMKNKDVMNILNKQNGIDKYICAMSIKYDYKTFSLFCRIISMLPFLQKYTKYRT